MGGGLRMRQTSHQRDMKVEEEKKKGNEKQTPKKFTEERTEV